jgi:outer membrane protein
MRTESGTRFASTPGRALTLVLLCCCWFWARTALGTDTATFEVWSGSAEAVEITHVLEPEDRERIRGDWFLRVGAIGGYGPEYLGADDYKAGFAPTARIVWRETLFLKDRKAGINLYQSEHLALGVFGRYTGGRKDKHSGLAGLGDIDRTITAGGFVNLIYKGVRFKSEIRHDVLDGKQGTLVQFAAGSRIPWNRPLLAVYLGSTWADSTYMSTFFGVNADQSLRSGLDRYRAGAGFRDVSLTASSGYRFGRHWQIGAQVQYLRLLGNAADSPIIRKSGSAEQVIVGLQLGYTF